MDEVLSWFEWPDNEQDFIVTSNINCVSLYQTKKKLNFYKPTLSFICYRGSARNF